MKKILNVFLTLMILFLVSCDNRNGKPEDEKPVVLPEQEKEETVYCKEISSVLRVGYSDEIILDDLITDDEFKDTIVMYDDNSDYHKVSLKIEFTDYEKDKTAVPRYRFTVFGDNSEYNFTNKPGDSEVICTVDFKIKDFYSLPSVRVTDVESGNVIYEEDFSGIEIVNVNRNESFTGVGRDSSYNYFDNLIDLRVGERNSSNFKKNKNLIDLCKSGLIDDSAFEFTYDEYTGYLKTAYEYLKENLIDDIKKGALVNNIIEEYYYMDLFEKNYDAEKEKDALYSKIDSVYESFDSFLDAYFSDYDDIDLKGVSFHIPKEILLTGDSDLYKFWHYRGGYNEYKKIYSTYKDIADYEGREFEDDFEVFSRLDIKEICNFNPLDYDYALYSDYGIFYNKAPGTDATEYEKEIWKDRYPLKYKALKDYQWKDPESFGGSVTERTGGLYLDSESNVVLRFSSFEYVEMYDGDKLVGKLRNSFFEELNDYLHRTLKTYKFISFSNQSYLLNTDMDKDGIFKPMIEKYSILYIKDDKPVIYDTERKYDSPYYIINSIDYSGF